MTERSSRRRSVLLTGMLAFLVAFGALVLLAAVAGAALGTPEVALLMVLAVGVAVMVSLWFGRRAAGR